MSREDDMAFYERIRAATESLRGLREMAHAVKIVERKDIELARVAESTEEIADVAFKHAQRLGKHFRRVRLPPPPRDDCDHLVYESGCSFCEARWPNEPGYP